ncbi:MAG: DMT family transporter [Candidatus Puniceispirillales bacterium]
MKFSIFERTTEDRPMMALGLILLGVMVLGFQDSLVKVVSTSTSFWQFQLIRSIFNLTFIVILARLTVGLEILRPRNPAAVLARAIMLSVCMMFFFGAAPQITVTQMAAGLYTYPLFITMMAGPILGEKIGPWRWGALLLGMAGSMTVLQPFSETFSWVQIMPIIAGFFYACNIIILRKYCRNESPLSLTFVVAIVFIIFGGSGGLIVGALPLDAVSRAEVPFLLVSWPTLTLAVFGFCMLASALNLMGNICLSRAYQTADSSWLAPLDFSYLLFVTLWGKLLFDTVPTPLAALGMVMIAAAGVVTAVREGYNARLRKQAG